MDETRDRTTERRLLVLLAETSVHAGTGAQLGGVDLPIQRERHTGWPTIYGTGLKGVLRDEASGAGWSTEQIRAVFGPETDRNGEREEARHSGALAISDARLLFFPVRTIGPAFAWITCPLALARFRRDAAEAKVEGVPELKEQPSGEQVVVSRSWKGAEQDVFLEEFSYQARLSAPLAEFADWAARQLLPTGPAYGYWRDLMPQAVVLLTDDDFRDFVRHATEVVTRVRLKDETKTVETGALWTEEHLPSDTLLYSFAAAWRPAALAPESPASPRAVMDKLASLLGKRPVIQVGGKETVGHGFVAVRLVGGNHA